MIRLSTSGTLLLAALLISPKACAWSGAGHMVIAAEAWRELPAETKSKVTGVLKGHPDFEQWQTSFSGEPSDLAAFVFMRASTWPDEIRRHGNKFDHPHWHYVGDNGRILLAERSSLRKVFQPAVGINFDRDGSGSGALNRKFELAFLWHGCSDVGLPERISANM